MWNTPGGERKLAGKERALFIEGVTNLCDQLMDVEEPDDECPTDVPVFDQIPIEERPYVLLGVARSVLGDDPAPKPTAWNEGAILAVFNHIRDEVEFEIDNEGEGGVLDLDPRWRGLVHEAWIERCYRKGEVDYDPDEGDKQAITSKNLDGWSFKIEGLADQLLFDRDCEMEEFLDMAPEAAQEGKREFGIPEEYFLGTPSILPEPQKEQLRAFHQALLTESKK